MARQLNHRAAERQASHYQQCVREARIAAMAWVVQLIVCTSLIVWLGYTEPAARPDRPPMILGIPRWVVIGVFIPWIAQIGFAWFFAVRLLRDDEPVEDPSAESRSEERS